MTTEDFVRSFKVQKEEMLEIYFSESPTAAKSSVAHVGTYVRSLRLNAEQSQTMRKILDMALTDAFYSILLGFDGCARIGNMEQQSFQVRSEDGSLVCRGDGKLEGIAYECFHAKDVG